MSHVRPRHHMLAHSDNTQGSSASLATEDLPPKTQSLLDLRKKRHLPTPSHKKIPGLDISALTTEKLELLVSLNLNDNPLTKAFRIKAAHVLATRYIEGKNHEKEHKAVPDQVKAYTYAEKEINSYTIQELEDNFFQIEVAGSNVNIVKFWQNIAKQRVLKRDKNPNGRRTVFYTANQLYDTKEIDKLIDQAKWNGLLKKEKARNANAILLAWEKQLIAARLAAHYKKLKKEKHDADSLFAAKFYKRLVHYLKEHEPPDSKISDSLKKISPRFNQLRLFLSRLGKIIAVINGSLPPPIRWIFNIAGLYFLIEFLIDLAVIIKDGREAFWEDNRPSRMANAAVWFVFNLACLVLTLVLAPVAPLAALLSIGILTVVGCVFDAGAEVAIGVYSYKSQQALLDKVETELKELDAIDPSNDTQKAALLETKKQLLEKRKEMYVNRVYTVAIMLILTIAAVFICFPFAALPLAPIIAAVTALVVGSVFGGIGKYLFWNTVMDPEFRAAFKEKFWSACRWVKELCVPKTKTPFNGNQITYSDDWHHVYRTKDIQASLEVPDEQEAILMDADNQQSTASDKPTPELPKHYLHRSPSGTLFVDAAKLTSEKTPPFQSTKPLNRSLG